MNRVKLKNLKNKQARGRDSTTLKRNIQTLAERTLLARFSEFCQEKINGNICYVFKQAGRELAFPDPPKLEHFKRGTQRKNIKEEREKEN
ncbi:unnamed protein product [Meloidogyne enterolobii]|uniref:Uncharacterized protein n=1 Tax=Meloidogyne enterolobii TaxID=390850 RepID=A0ACB1AYF4_MELEN